MIKLGLIGDNISQSRMPKLVQLCSEMCGLDASYELLIPQEHGVDFDALFSRCEALGFRGLNITLPYKIRVVPKLIIEDEMVRRVGAVNTVVFDGGKAFGHNTDYSGFIAAYRNQFGNKLPGQVLIAGAGGAGRAVAFALLALGATHIQLFDHNQAMANELARDLGTASSFTSIEAAMLGCEGVVNCSPIGMHGYEGTAIPAGLLNGKSWAFDAVYTPMNTVFLQDAKAAGLAVMGGYELHFYQGILAFKLFTGREPEDLVELRKRHLAV